MLDCASKQLTVHRTLPLEPALFRPGNDIADPVLSIVVPALNEEVTIAQFVAWCKEGIGELGIPAEILIVDSSTDRTPEIALDAGARVLRTPKGGLGRAYIDALPFVRGKYLVLGDADCTYDFRELKPFLEKFEEGYEYIMGSRFRGSIEDGAMPALHRYFGTPLTTWILNLMYHTNFSDIHCGMRGITRDAFVRMRLASQSWEYASEMVLKSVHMGLRQAEVPVSFFKDMEGRTSHHVRAGWFSPWQAGWINLKAMFVFGADFFLWWPGSALLIAGLLGLSYLAAGPRTVFGVVLSLNAMLFALVSYAVGLQMMLTAIVAVAITDGRGLLRKKWLRYFDYTRTTVLVAAGGATGMALIGRFVLHFIQAGPALGVLADSTNHLAIIGLALVIGAVLLFTNMLVLHAVTIYVPHPAEPASPRAAINAEKGQGT